MPCDIRSRGFAPTGNHCFRLIGSAACAALMSTQQCGRPGSRCFCSSKAAAGCFGGTPSCRRLMPGSGSAGERQRGGAPLNRERRVGRRLEEGHEQVQHHVVGGGRPGALLRLGRRPRKHDRRRAPAAALQSAQMRPPAWPLPRRGARRSPASTPSSRTSRRSCRAPTRSACERPPPGSTGQHARPAIAARPPTGW